jgi:hypothetical protein
LKLEFILFKFECSVHTASVHFFTAPRLEFSQ